MNIFVVNSGSSSIKYQLFKMPVEKPVCSGLVERIGLENSNITHKIFSGREEKIINKTIKLSGHEEGLLEVAKLLTDAETGVIKKPGEIDVVGDGFVLRWFLVRVEAAGGVGEDQRLAAEPVEGFDSDPHRADVAALVIMAAALEERDIIVEILSL